MSPEVIQGLLVNRPGLVNWKTAGILSLVAQ